MNVTKYTHFIGGQTDTQAHRQSDRRDQTHYQAVFADGKMTLCRLHYAAQFAAEILLLPVTESNGHHVGILLPVSILTFSWSSTWHSESAYQISSKTSATEL